MPTPLLALLATACSSPPPSTGSLTDAEFEELAEHGDFIPYTAIDPDEERARVEARTERDQELLRAFAQTRPDLEAAWFAELQGTPTPEGNRLGDHDGTPVVLLGDRARFGTIAAAVRAYEAPSNQRALLAALEPLLPEHCRAPLPPPEVTETLGADELRDLNQAARACWVDWKASGAALPPHEVAEPDQAQVEGAGTGSDSGNCGLPIYGDYYSFGARWALPEVRNQGNRGTCASFAASSALEYGVARHFQRFVNFSEQALYASAKFGFVNEHYEDGLPTGDTLFWLDESDVPLALEGEWSYNPSNQRISDDVSRTYMNSCVNYDEACSDTAHQMALYEYDGDRYWWAPRAADATRYETVKVIELYDFTDEALDYVRMLIDAGWGIVVSMDITDDFINGDYQVPSGEFEGGHAMHLVSIESDPLAGGGYRVLLKNSWACWWGSEGYGLVDASYINHYLRSIIAIVPRKGPGNQRPVPSIDLPVGPIDVPLGGIETRTTFFGTATDLEDVDCCQLSWTSSLEGALGTGPTLEHRFVTEGTHEIRLTAVDSDGAVGEDTVLVTVTNDAPDVTIFEPSPGHVAKIDEAVVFQAEAADASEPLGFPCSAFEWTSSNPADPFPVTGCGVGRTFDTIGSRTLTVTVTDSYGATASDSVSIQIEAPDPDDLPTIAITNPLGGANLDPEAATGFQAITSSQHVFSSIGWTLTYKNVDYPFTPPSGPLATMRVDDILGFSDCGSHPATLEATITDANGTAVDTIQVTLGWKAC